MTPLYDGEGFKRKLIGYISKDRSLWTVGLHPSQPVKQPKEWAMGTPIAKQIHPNRMHIRRMQAMLEKE